MSKICIDFSVEFGALLVEHRELCLHPLQLLTHVRRICGLVGKTEVKLKVDYGFGKTSELAQE